MTKDKAVERKQLWFMDVQLPDGEWFLWKFVSHNERRFRKTVAFYKSKGHVVRTHTDKMDVCVNTSKILGRKAWRRKMQTVYRFSRPDRQHFWNAFAEYFTHE